MTNEETIVALAEEMLGVFDDHVLIRKTETPIEAVSITEAYDIQDRVIATRVSRGERVAGYKVGCTSPEIRAQFGLSEPICGRLMFPFVHDGTASLQTDAYLDCAVEPELVLRIGRPIARSDVDDGELRSAVAAVASGVEIHNYRFMHGPPTLQELIASNGIHAGLVIGSWNDLGSVELAEERVELDVNGRVVASGIGRDIMGGPFESLRWLITHLARRGGRLEEGDLVIPGSAVGLVRVNAGDTAQARHAHLGRCTASFV